MKILLISSIIIPYCLLGQVIHGSLYNGEGQVYYSFTLESKNDTVYVNKINLINAEDSAYTIYRSNNATFKNLFSLIALLEKKQFKPNHFKQRKLISQPEYIRPFFIINIELPIADFKGVSTTDYQMNHVRYIFGSWPWKWCFNRRIIRLCAQAENELYSF